MRLLFLGTRGAIDARTHAHRRHTATLVSHAGGRPVMIDCGDDWRGRWQALEPAAVVVTHGHADHADGLRDGAPCPVYATAAAWEVLGGHPIRRRRTVESRRPFRVAGLCFEAFPVEHSLRCPAVGYRISAGGVTIFYVPDVLAIPDAAAALRGVRLYVGDGASLLRPIVRRSGGRLVGHASMRAQLDWCAREGVPRVIFTHCGTHIVGGDERRVARRLAGLAALRGLTVAIARDATQAIASKAADSRRF